MASIGVVALIYSLVGPLIAINLERRGTPSIVNGALAAMPGLAVLLCGVIIPSVVRRCGTIVSICAGTGLAIAALVLFPLFDLLPVWFVLRFVMGFSIGLIWVVSETWVNVLAPDRIRGRVMGVYVTVLSVGSAAGPLLIGAMGTEGNLPFYVSAAILALALLPVPIAASGGAVPTFHQRESIPLRRAASQAPLVMALSVISGALTIVTWTLLPIYSIRAGLPESQAVWLVTGMIVGGIAGQVPVGYFLDRFSTSNVIIGIGVLQVVCVMVFPALLHVGPGLWLLLIIWGGSGSGIYTVALTMLGRAYSREQLPSANTAFTMFWECGAFVGPIFGGVAMSIWNPHGVLVVFVSVGSVLVLFGVFGRTRRAVSAGC